MRAIRALWAGATTAQPPLPRPSPSPESRVGEGSDDDDDDDDDVDELLHSAQVLVIRHKHDEAIAKLDQAVSLGSSAACATLGNLLARGIRDRPGKPVDSPLLDGSSGVPADGEAAAKLFIAGLDLELAKPLERLGGLARQQESLGVEDLGAGVGSNASAGSSASEEESVEGRVFNLERVLELVVGLTDSYRYGVLKPPTVLERSSASTTETTDTSLWARGAQVAERTLRHPLVADGTETSALVHNRSRPRPPSHSTHTKLPSSNRPPSPASPGATISPSSGSFPFPSDFCFPPSQLASHLKLRPTIQIHLFYLLALHLSPSNLPEAERLWTKIVLIGTEHSKDVGTKEGNEILEKAQRRLLSQRQPDDSWKESKRRGRSVSTSPAVASSSSAADGSATQRGEGAMSGDALIAMWYEMGGSSTSEKGKEKERERESEDDMGESVHASSPLSSGKSSIPRALRPTQQAPSPAMSGITLRPVDSCSYVSGFGTPDLDRPALEASLHSLQQHGQEPPPTFFFARLENYPSPPDTPAPSPPVPDLPFFTTPPRPSSQPDPKPPASPQSDRPRLRHKFSTTSFQPPTIPRLLRRAQLSSSISILPPDFGSTKIRNPIGRRDWRSTSQPTTLSFAIRDDPPLLPLDPPPLTPFWGRLAVLRSSSSRLALGVLSSLKHEPAKPSAVDVLQNVLLKDDLSAGPGMYWAEPSEIEDGGEASAEPVVAPIVQAGAVVIAVEEEEEVVIFPPVASGSGTQPPRAPRTPNPRLATRRSFVDVTSRPPAAHCPRVTCTPPTPEKHQFRTEAGGLDPLLLELERKSRVGVRSVCARCGKRGINFPVGRTGETYCTRECRLGDLPGAA